MSVYYGDINPGDILDFKFTTVRDTGAPHALSGNQTPGLLVYKDNSSTTESIAGVTLSTNFDSVTGLNHVRVDTASDGAFYSSGSNFQVMIATGTINGVSATGYMVASFSIQARSALRPTVSGRTLDVTAGGTAGIDFGNAENTGSTMNLSATTINTIASTGLGAIADAVHDEVVEGTTTLRQTARLLNSTLGAKLSGAATTTVTVRDLADSKDRVTATVDANGNRSAVTLDLT